MKRSEGVVAAILVMLSVAGVRTAAAQYGVIYNFETNNGGIVHPVGTLRTDAQGNLFGAASNGTAFELSRNAHGGYIEKTIQNGPGGSDWIPDANGNYYTAVNCSGPCSAPDGQIIEASPAAGGGWSRKVIYTFGLYATDGISANNNLVFDTQGNLYGTTQEGGTNSDGIVFELTPSAHGSWSEKILYNFGANSTDAANPAAGLTIDATGDLYGTTVSGGPLYYDDCYGRNFQGGTVYELVRQSNVTWTEKILYNFTPSVNNDFCYMTESNGYAPMSNLVLDNEGNLYGTTSQGVTLYGYSGPSGTIMEGGVFKLTPVAAGQWTEQALLLTCDNQVDCYPDSNLALDPAGNVYGTTAGGGSNLGVPDGSGDTVIEVTPQFQENVLYNFPSTQTDGSPSGGVTLSEGGLFGVTSNGGPDAYGTAYEIQGVANPTPIATTTALVASPSTNLVAGEPITLTATVTSASGLNIPTGTVTFMAAGRGVTELLVAGKAVYTGVVPPAGTYSLSAGYGGGPGFAASKSATITASVPASGK